MEKETFKITLGTRSDQLQQKHDEVRNKTKHDCQKPCAICSLFIPGQHYIDQLKKKESNQ